MKLSDKEVDALPCTNFPATQARLRMRREWGERAGHAAFARGDNRNPFWEPPGKNFMPMHAGWAHGFQDAQRARDATINRAGDNLRQAQMAMEEQFHGWRQPKTAEHRTDAST